LALLSGTKYRKAVEGWNDIQSEFYSNGSPNDDLESRFKNTLRAALRFCTRVITYMEKVASFCC
jgi:hypothetical protein